MGGPVRRSNDQQCWQLLIAVRGIAMKPLRAAHLVDGLHDFHLVHIAGHTDNFLSNNAGQLRVSHLVGGLHDFQLVHIAGHPVRDIHSQLHRHTPAGAHAARQAAQQNAS